MTVSKALIRTELPPSGGGGRGGYPSRLTRKRVCAEIMRN